MSIISCKHGAWVGITRISFCQAFVFAFVFAFVCLSIGVSVYPWDFSAMFLIAKKYDGPNVFADATHNLALA